MANPAAVAESANIAPLYATRSGGRWPIRCVTVAPPAATKIPACQPKSTIAATASTSPSVTPPDSTPSTGTGNRSTTTMPTNSAAIEMSVAIECGVSTKVTIATPIAATPATSTGVTIARTLDGGREAAFTVPLQGRARLYEALPASPVSASELVEIPAPLGRQDPAPLPKQGSERHQQNQQEDEPRFPLQHFPFPPRAPQDARPPNCAKSAPPTKSPEGVIVRFGTNIPRKLGKARFREGTAPPGELGAVPAGERGERDAVPGGVDEPAVAQVDAHVADLRRVRARPLVAEEDDVGGLELRECDPPGRRHLAAHLVRRPAAERRGQRARAGIPLELVDAPDEARAVVAAARRHAERRLRAVRLAAPDVGHADLRDGAVEDPPLPVGERRQGEGLRRGLDARDLPVGEVEDLRDRIGRLRAVRRVLRPQLEGVLVRRVVQAQPEQAGDGLGAETRGDGQPAGACALRE